MKILPVIIFFTMLVIAGCNNNQPDAPKEKDVDTSQDSDGTLIDLTTTTEISRIICQNWENKEDAEDAEASGGGSSIEIPYRGFSFFSDGTVTENPRDNIRFGKWKFNEGNKTIVIEFEDKSKASHKIGAIGPEQMVLLNLANKEKATYKADGWAQQSPADDPFHLSNNRWRIKPKRSENDSLIKSRVKQVVLFYARFLKDNGSRGGNSISFVGLPTCFKWYRGGISITGQEKLGDKWVNCFYNREQAEKGQQMLENIIGKKYKWNKQETNWVKQSAEVMKQVYDTLR